MRRFALPLLALCLLLSAPAPGADAEGGRTLRGEYRSNHGDGPVKATFTPSGDRLWNVRFDFTFNGRSHTYEGTAEGSFAEGRLQGRVENEYGRRTFAFRGEFENGTFRGSHAEVRRGREAPTGTLVLEE